MAKTIFFKHEDYPELDIQIDVSPKLFGLNYELRESGMLLKPDDFNDSYLIPYGDREIRLKFSSTPLASRMIIDGNKYELDVPMKWYDILAGGFPVQYILIGGVFGGFLGFLCWSSNMNYLRYNDSPQKYVQTFLMTIFILIILPLLIMFLLSPDSFKDFDSFLLIPG